MPKQITVFRIDKQFYGIDIDDVKEILRVQPITSLPSDAPHVEGVINLRGSLCTIVNGRVLLGFEKIEKTEDQNIMVLGDGKVGMLVDEVTEILTIEESDIKALEGMGTLDNIKYIDYIVEKNGNLITVIRIKGLVIPETNNEETL